MLHHGSRRHSVCTWPLHGTEAAQEGHRGHHEEHTPDLQHQGNLPSRCELLYAMDLNVWDAVRLGRHFSTSVLNMVLVIMV